MILHFTRDFGAGNLANKVLIACLLLEFVRTVSFDLVTLQQVGGFSWGPSVQGPSSPHSDLAFS
jgi:hypothetical protein